MLTHRKYCSLKLNLGHNNSTRAKQSKAQQIIWICMGCKVYTPCCGMYSPLNHTGTYCTWLHWSTIHQDYPTCIQDNTNPLVSLFHDNRPGDYVMSLNMRFAVINGVQVPLTVYLHIRRVGFLYGMSLHYMQSFTHFASWNHIRPTSGPHKHTSIVVTWQRFAINTWTTGVMWHHRPGWTLARVIEPLLTCYQWGPEYNFEIYSSTINN